MRNPLAWLARRFPRAFGLEWVDTEEFFETDDPRTFDLRPVRVLTGDMLPIGWGPDYEGAHRVPFNEELA